MHLIAALYDYEIVILSYIFRFLAPYDCLVCGREGALLCGDCQSNLIKPLPSHCYRCKKTTQNFKVCAKCRENTHLDHAWIASNYASVIKKLIHQYKFERAQDCATLLADLLLKTLPTLSPDTIITFVPTATKRVRQRGYDQSKLLAKAFALSHKSKFATLLVRHGQTRQVGADKKQRQSQLANSYTPKNLNLIKGRSILIIDDILTTGSTLEAAARILKQAGAQSVDALVVAQASKQ